MQKQSIIIVGAGIAGLIAARALIKKYDIVILEAAGTTGGRIRTIRADGFPTHIEAGPEFIHGHLKETIKLLKEAGLKYEAVEGIMYRKEKGVFKQEEDFIEGWNILLKEMKHLKKDITLRDFLYQYFSGEKYAALRNQAMVYAEGFDVADVTKVSTKALYNEWSKEEHINYRIVNGYGALIDFLTAACEREGVRIITNEAVKQIDWSIGAVTAFSANENKYTADKVIITIPVGVLQSENKKASISFTPSLEEYSNAAKQIGFGNVIKLMLQFKAAFWQKDAGFFFSEEKIPTWWTQLPNKTALLTGWVGGGKADRLRNESQDGLLRIALESLSGIFDLPADQLRNELVAFKIINWEKDEWSLGAYNYAMPKTTEALKVLNTPINDTIYFCGEALYEGVSPGTVEAAIVHAQKVAKKLI